VRACVPGVERVVPCRSDSLTGTCLGCVRPGRRWRYAMDRPTTSSLRPSVPTNRNTPDAGARASTNCVTTSAVRPLTPPPSSAR
jgi:hypothetical protein